MSGSDLYEKALVDHAKRPRNFGPLEGANRRAQGSNPLCGDELTLHLRLEGERIAAAGFEGAGCAICLASASLMTLALAGLTVSAAEELARRFDVMLAGGAAGELGDLAALANVSRYPSRVRCAKLAWRALEAAMSGAPGAVSTEEGR
jgi:nitrogen fixation protein NifU and related proteins